MGNQHSSPDSAPPPLVRVQRSRPAMATIFEVLVVGEDAEQLTSAAEAALDEIERIAMRFNRHHPQSEVARVNREAARSPVRIDRELAWLVALGQTAWEATGGVFDLACGPIAGAESATWRDVRFDPAEGTIAFAREGVRLDLGAIGKGYALDRAAEILVEQGVTCGLLHGGTSSVLALAADPATPAGWPIALSDPWPAAEGADAIPLATLSLARQALSCSFVFPPERGAESGEQPSSRPSDVIDPRSGQALAEQAGCVVVTESATEAEILSTAALCLGREAAAAFLIARPEAAWHLGWMHPPEHRPRLEWLGPRGNPFAG